MTTCIYGMQQWPLQGPYSLQLPQPHSPIRGQALGMPKWRWP